jgi:hypothetical protein
VLEIELELELGFGLGTGVIGVCASIFCIGD